MNMVALTKNAWGNAMAVWTKLFDSIMLLHWHQHCQIYTR